MVRKLLRPWFGSRWKLLLALSSCLSLASPPAVEASASGCPNEALRSALHSEQLPDCRAYELVTPPAKNGWSVEVSGVAPDGMSMLANSLGGFAGSDQAGLKSVYKSVRTTAGWETAPVAGQPAGLSNATEANPPAGSLDLSEGLFKYRPASAANLSEGGFYRRTLPGGPAVEVGPLFSPTVLAANPPGREEETSVPSVSNDATRVLYTILGPSLTNNGNTNYLWPGDTTVENTGPLNGGQGFVSLYEYTGTGNSAPALVGVDNGGELISQCGTSLGFPAGGNFSSFRDDELYNAISMNGSKILFTAAAAAQGPSRNACTGAGAGTGPRADELFARIGGAKTVALSEPSLADCKASLCNVSEPVDAVFQGASADGSKVFFLTTQALLRSDGDKTTDLYEYDFNAPEGERIIQVSRGGAGDATPGTGAQVRGVARVSEDGSRVYFVARGELTSASSPAGLSAHSGGDNLYVCNTESKQTAFIGTLSGADASDWRQEDSRPVDATPPDGRFLVFTSRADLTPDDTSSAPQVFEYDAQAGTLVRVSIGQDGFNDNGNTGKYEASIVHPFFREYLNPAFQPSSVSDDGAYVVFRSNNNLTRQAAAGVGNVYEYHGGRVSLISDGQSRTPSVLVGIDGSGADVFFTTADRLVPQDGDTQEDVYDARIDGGFPAPPPAAVCEGDGCQGALGPVPSFVTIGSVSQPVGEQVIEPPAGPVARGKTKAKTKAKRKKTKRAKPKMGIKSARHRDRRSARGSGHR